MGGVQLARARNSMHMGLLEVLDRSFASNQSTTLRIFDASACRVLSVSNNDQQRLADYARNSLMLLNSSAWLDFHLLKRPVAYRFVERTLLLVAISIKLEMIRGKCRALVFVFRSTHFSSFLFCFLAVFLSRARSLHANE